MSEPVRKKKRSTQSNTPSSFGKDIILMGDCKSKLDELQSGSVSLVFSSPPYNIGKSYEKRASLIEYLKEQRIIILKLCKLLEPNGSICWQVGNYVIDGEIVPIDLSVHPFFLEGGLKFRKRFVWSFGHGLHCQNRFSGRYETISWYSRGDAVISPKSDFLKKEWSECVMDIPNVKSNHIEKTTHPCQFPIELVERFVLTLTKPGDTVLDPYCGAGSAIVAAVRHGRCGIGIELLAEYANLATERVSKLKINSLAIRELGTAIHVPSTRDSVSKLPASWVGIVNDSIEKEKAFNFMGTYETKKRSLKDALPFVLNLKSVPTLFIVKISSVKHLESLKSVIDTVKDSNICFLFDHDEIGFGDLDEAILRNFSSNLQLRNRILTWHPSGISYTSILWFTRGTHTTFNLDAVRVPSKYPGKKSTSSGKLSGNPLGKNPSDIWRDCCGVCNNNKKLGLGGCQWERLLRALSNTGDNILLISEVAPDVELCRDVFHAAKRSLLFLEYTS